MEASGSQFIMAKSKGAKNLSGGCLSLFGLPFLAAGLFMTGMYFSGYLEWWDARGWEEVPCWIEMAEMETSSGESTTYEATANYRYEYGGRVFHGDRVSFQGGADNIGDFQQDAHRELSRYAASAVKGAEHDPAAEGREAFRCYVNPDDPEESVLYRTLRWPMQAFFAIFALTFPAVGAGLVAGGIIAVRKAKGESKLRAQNPEKPWMWRKQWATSSIPESAGWVGAALWLYTVWAGLIILTLISAMFVSGAFEQGGASWLVMIFVMLWCVPAWFLLRRLRHRMAVGVTRFMPVKSPAWPGGVLEGSVLLGRPLPMRHAAELELICEKKVTRGSGDNRNTTTEKVWSASESVANDRIVRDVSGFRLPVRFVLPGDAPESDVDESSNAKHEWQLRLKVAGTPIAAAYDIPVFRTADSPDVIEDSAAGVVSISDVDGAELPELLAARRIVAEFDSAGAPRSIVCPAARNRSVIVFLVIFDLIWTALAMFLVKQDAPLIFQIVWPVSAVLIWAGVIWSLLHKRAVTFDVSGLEVRNQLGPVVWTQSFTKADIAKFSHDSNMTSNNTSYYRVRLKNVQGKYTTLADGITESTTAKALAERLQAWKAAD